MTRTDNETTLTIYSIVENSKPFQNRLGKFFDKILYVCDILKLKKFHYNIEKLDKSSRKKNPRCLQAGNHDS